MEMLVYLAFIVLVPEAWGLERVLKSESFRQEQDVQLTCGNKTWQEDKIIFIIWKLTLKGKICTIHCKHEGDYVNNCRDHKFLRNITEGQPVLHIPRFSVSDVGNYTCDCVYPGGADSYIYHVNIIAPPKTSAWIEMSGDRGQVVCRAERASPAANISWTFAGNVTNETVLESDGLISVQSSMEVRADEDLKNLSCIVAHPYWEKPWRFAPTLRTSQRTNQNHYVVYATVAVSVVFCLALLVWGIKKLHNLRKCQKSSIKSSPEEYVEEVEPYESYVQRVNSIYNSSRDLFA